MVDIQLLIRLDRDIGAIFRVVQMLEGLSVLEHERG